MYVISDKDNQPILRKCHLAILAIFRNEAHILLEWLNHYLNFGVDRFYLINNNSDDDFRQILKPFVQSGIVQLFNCARDSYQIGAYRELLPLICGRTQWLAVFDLDEFIYSPVGDALPSVLCQFGDAEAILVPWLSFGSSGHLEQPESVVHSFTFRGPAQVSRAFLKAFTRPETIVEMSQHNPRTYAGRKVLANGEPATDATYIHLNEDQLASFAMLNNHYRLQSSSYFNSVKIARPEVHESVADQRKAMNFFMQNDVVWNSVEDTRLAEISLGLPAPGIKRA